MTPKPQLLLPDGSFIALTPPTKNTFTEYAAGSFCRETIDDTARIREVTLQTPDSQETYINRCPVYGNQKIEWTTQYRPTTNSYVPSIKHNVLSVYRTWQTVNSGNLSHRADVEVRLWGDIRIIVGENGNLSIKKGDKAFVPNALEGKSTSVPISTEKRNTLVEQDIVKQVLGMTLTPDAMEALEWAAGTNHRSRNFLDNLKTTKSVIAKS
jgi:hypothetical protein